MDTRTDRIEPTEALARVVAQARRIPFVALVHLIERLLPNSVPVGTTGPVSREAVRLRHDPSLGFQPSDIAQARVVRHGSAPHVEITATFLGLTGASSPLPLFFAEEFAHTGDDGIQRELLDVFHHRLLSLLVRGVLKFDYPRTFKPDGTDALSRRVLALAGLSSEHAERVTRLPRALLLKLAPLLAMYPPNVERLRLALVAALGDNLKGAVVRIESFTGGHVAVTEAARPRLGQTYRLGKTASLGGRVKSPASKICIAIAPLGADALERFSPGGEAFVLLCAVADLLLPSTVGYDVELTPGESVGWQLGTTTKSRLGRSAWLGAAKRPVPVRFSASRPAPNEVP